MKWIGTCLVVAALLTLGSGIIWACTTVRCPLHSSCYGTDTPCLGCDPLGWDITCTDVNFVDYNPASLVIKRCVSDPEENTVCENGDEVICMVTQNCDEGGLQYVSLCQVSSGPNQWDCTAVDIGVCQTCHLVGDPTNHIVTNQRCVEP